jgi:hypothetical protein
MKAAVARYKWGKKLPVAWAMVLVDVCCYWLFGGRHAAIASCAHYHVIEAAVAGE